MVEIAIRLGGSSLAIIITIFCQSGKMDPFYNSALAHFYPGMLNSTQVGVFTWVISIITTYMILLMLKKLSSWKELYIFLLICSACIECLLWCHTGLGARIWQGTSSNSCFDPRTCNLLGYHLIQWFSTGGNFTSWGAFGNIWGLCHN